MLGSINRFSVLIIAIGIHQAILAQSKPAPATESAEVEAKVKQAHDEFTRRYDRWERYLREQGVIYSSVVLPYLDNEPFWDLAEMGPAVVPWVEEKAHHSAMMIHLLTLVSRSHWTDLAGLNRHEAADPARDHRKDLASFWRTVPDEVMKKGRQRVSAFRESPSAGKGMPFAAARSSQEWRSLEALGVFGIPVIMERVRSGKADVHDYRLLQHWTGPLARSEKNTPVLPAVSESVSKERQDRQYWISWWEQNKWQFWWLDSQDQPTTAPE